MAHYIMNDTQRICNTGGKIEKILPISFPQTPTPTTTTATNRGTISVANHPSGYCATTVPHTTSSTPVKTIFNEKKTAWDKRGSNMNPATHLHHISHMRRLTKFALLLHTWENPGSILGPREWQPGLLQVSSIRGSKIQQNLLGLTAASRGLSTPTFVRPRPPLCSGFWCLKRWCTWATWRGLLAREYFTVLWMCWEYDQLGLCSAVYSSLV